MVCDRVRRTGALGLLAMLESHRPDQADPSDYILYLEKGCNPTKPKGNSRN